MKYRLTNQAGRVIINCINCGREVETVLSRVIQGNKKYCSNKCKDEFRIVSNRTHTDYKDKQCPICKKMFSKPTKRGWGIKKWKKTQFCSKTCQNIARSNSNNNLWRGGEHIDPSGYLLIHSPEHPNKNAGKYVMKHRLVAEKHLQRFLSASEVIHHIDGDKTNNRVENLYLFSSKSKHMSFHKKPHGLKTNLPC